jgi:hypothetical protein
MARGRDLEADLPERWSQQKRRRLEDCICFNGGRFLGLRHYSRTRREDTLAQVNTNDDSRLRYPFMYQLLLFLIGEERLGHCQDNGGNFCRFLSGHHDRNGRGVDV